MWEILAFKINKLKTWEYVYSRDSPKIFFSIFFLFTWIGFTDKESEFCVKSWHGLPNNFRAYRQNWLCTFMTISPNRFVCRLRHLLSISLLCSILLIVLASASPKQNKSMSLLCGPLARACFSFLSQCRAHTAPSLLSYSPAPLWSCKSQVERLGERKCNTKTQLSPSFHFVLFFIGRHHLRNSVKMLLSLQELLWDAERPTCPKIDQRLKCKSTT